MTDDPRRHPGPPTTDGDPTWFTTAGLVRSDEEWRLTAADAWHGYTGGGQPVGADQWVQVRRSPHPQPEATLYTTTGGEADYPVTFAELHALIDTEVGSGIPVNRRLSLARAVWRLLTPE